MVNTAGDNADHGCDFYHFADHMTKLQTFTKGEIRKFSAFPCSLYLMFNQTLSNIIICVMISQILHTIVANTS